MITCYAIVKTDDIRVLRDGAMQFSRSLVCQRVESARELMCSDLFNGYETYILEINPEQEQPEATKCSDKFISSRLIDFHLPDIKDTSPLLLRSRTLAMNERGLPNYDPESGFMLDMHDRLCRVLNRSVTNFNQRIACAGGGARETFIVEPEDEHIQACLQWVRTRIDTENWDYFDFETQLVSVCEYIRSYIQQDKYNHEDVVTRLSTFIAEQSKATPEREANTSPVVSLNALLEKGLFVCRHYAVFTAVVLTQLKPLLKDIFSLRVYRSLIPGRGTHSIVGLQNESSSKIYSLDLMWAIVGAVDQADIAKKYISPLPVTNNKTSFLDGLIEACPLPMPVEIGKKRSHSPTPPIDEDAVSRKKPKSLVRCDAAIGAGLFDRTNKSESESQPITSRTPNTLRTFPAIMRAGTAPNSPRAAEIPGTPTTQPMDSPGASQSSQVSLSSFV